VLVDPDAVTSIDADALFTKCGWTPFEGFDAVFPEWTMIRGEIVYDRDGGFSPRDGQTVRLG